MVEKNEEEEEQEEVKEEEAEDRRRTSAAEKAGKEAGGDDDGRIVGIGLRSCRCGWSLRVKEVGLGSRTVRVVVVAARGRTMGEEEVRYGGTWLCFFWG